MNRIRHLDIVGLNADIFLTHLFRLVVLTGEKIGTSLLYRLINDDAARVRLTERFLAEGPAGGAPAPDAEIISAMEACMRGTPPALALDLVNTLYAETIEKRRLVTVEELLRPGRIVHIDPGSHAGSCIAYAIKDTLQRSYLAGRHAPGSVMLLLIHGWYAYANMRLDGDCLKIPDSMLLLGVPSAAPVLDSKSRDLVGLLNRVSRQFWHHTPDARSTDLFDVLSRDIPNAREKFKGIAEGMVLCRVGSNLTLRKISRHGDSILHEVMLRRREEKERAADPKKRL